MKYFSQVMSVFVSILKIVFSSCYSSLYFSNQANFLFSWLSLFEASIHNEGSIISCVNFQNDASFCYTQSPSENYHKTEHFQCESVLSLVGFKEILILMR